MDIPRLIFGVFLALLLSFALFRWCDFGRLMRSYRRSVQANDLIPSPPPEHTVGVAQVAMMIFFVGITLVCAFVGGLLLAAAEGGV